MAQIAHRGDPRHARATLQRVQVAFELLHGRRLFLVIRPLD